MPGTVREEGGGLEGEVKGGGWWWWGDRMEQTAGLFQETKVGLRVLVERSGGEGSGEEGRGGGGLCVGLIHSKWANRVTGNERLQSRPVDHHD